eukprot:TRINITY_DN4045_c0_g1_i1.p1 TRINITY_DN4045_c0_g1~~TRINITY_DN4045_c0_g1_i1.p1  ORF type:complete len:722 (-),score=96.15 TRINITY_DN4045_c0_g1_i1:28-2079(-)
MKRIPDIDEETLKILEQQGLNGGDLFLLKKSDLRGCGIVTGPLVRIWNEISNLKKEKPTKKENYIWEDAIMRLSGSSNLRKKFTLPRNAMKLSEFYFHRAYGREDAFEEVLSKIYSRWRYYTEKEKPRNDYERRVNNRLMATMCCPGGGKTFFLDSISHLQKVMSEKEYIQLFKTVGQENDSEFKEWYERVIFLPVSFWGDTSIDQSEKLPWQFELAVRILYGYLFKTSSVSEFKQFRNKITFIPEKIKSSILSIVKEQIWKKEVESGNKRPCFMILVDEISKLSNPDDRLALTSAVGSFLDSDEYGQYDALITTLDTTPLKNCDGTASNRKLIWIPLKAPGVGIARELFNTTNITSQFQFLLFSCCFHWRSMETVKREEPELLKLQFYPKMADKVASELPNVPQLVPTDEPKIIATILAQEISLSTKLNGLTLEQCIYHGYFVNSISSTKSLVVPLMSFFLIERWARTMPPSKNNHLAMLLTSIVDVFKQGIDCYSYTKFHGLWEAIRRCAFVNGRRSSKMNITQLYNNLGQIGKFDNQEIIVDKGIEPNYEINTSSELIDRMYKSGLHDRSLLKKVHVMIDNSPGFDILIFHQTPNRNHMVAIAINTKFSKNNTTQEITEIKKNQMRTLEQFPVPARSNVYFVACCWKESRDYEKIPDNTIIISKENLSLLYGSLVWLLKF